jgi:hypothetical protein
MMKRELDGYMRGANLDLLHSLRCSSHFLTKDVSDVHGLPPIADYFQGQRRCIRAGRKLSPSRAVPTGEMERGHSTVADFGYVDVSICNNTMNGKSCIRFDPQV